MWYAKLALVMAGLALITLAFWKGTGIVVQYNTMPLLEREAQLFFATAFFFLGFSAISAHPIFGAGGGRVKMVAARLIFAGNSLMAAWVLVGPFVGYPFLGLAPFTLL
jgi:hypothetical protein